MTKELSPDDQKANRLALADYLEKYVTDAEYNQLHFAPNVLPCCALGHALRGIESGKLTLRRVPGFIVAYAFGEYPIFTTTTTLHDGTRMGVIAALRKL